MTAKVPNAGASKRYYSTPGDRQITNASSLINKKLYQERLKSRAKELTLLNAIGPSSTPEPHYEKSFKIKDEA